MRLRADQQLFLTYLALVAVLTLATSFGVDSVLRTVLTQEVGDDLRREIQLAQRLYDGPLAGNPELAAETIAELSSRRVSIIGTNGVLRGEAGSDGESLPVLNDYRIRTEIQQALDTGQGQAIRSDQAGRRFIFVAIRTGTGDILRLTSALANVNDAIATVQRALFGSAAVGVLIALLFAFGFSRSIVAPLRRIGDAARALATGDLSRRIRISRDDELGDLGNALNTLADELQRRLGQLEGERAEMQALIDAMSEGVLAISPKGLLRRANPAARRIFALGDRPSGLAPEMISRRTDFLAIVNRALDGETVPPRELSGGGVFLLATAHPLPDGGAVLVFLDVTELRRLEGVRRDFVANASHELKTPLTAIRGYSETLDDPDLEPDLVRRFARIVKSNADRLQRIVDDLLDLSRIEAGGWQIRPSWVDVHSLTNDVWGTLNPEKDVRLEFDIARDHGKVWVDPGALRQILTNLLGNAVRYTPENGSITVRTSGFEPDRRLARLGGETGSARTEWTVIEVGDTGSGIPSAHLSRIFERFYRVDPARSREEGGTGLGLSIVKHLVESHGGWIDAESQVGVGTTIRFAMPADEGV